MVQVLTFVLRMLLYLAPLYFANSSAMLLGGKTQIDFGMKLWDGNQVFGKGKTFRGFISGFLVGTAVALVISVILPGPTQMLSKNYAILGSLLALGAVSGDLAASFLKRRMGIQPGKEVLFLDQLDFLAGGILFASVLYTPTIPDIIVYAIATVFMHRLSNYLAFKAKLKKVPW